MKGKTDQVVKLAGDQPKNWRATNPRTGGAPRREARQIIGVAYVTYFRHDRRATIPKRMAESGKQGGRAPASLNTSGVPRRVRAGVRTQRTSTVTGNSQRAWKSYVPNSPKWQSGTWGTRSAGFVPAPIAIASPALAVRYL